MGWTFDPVLDQKLVPSGGGSGFIPEYSADPASPGSQTSWVLKTVSGGGGGNAGQPVGLLLAITQAGTGSPTTTYQFSYQTIEGPIIRTALS